MKEGSFLKNREKPIVHGTFHDVYDYNKMIELDANTVCSSKRVLPQNEKCKQKVFKKVPNKKGCTRGK